MTETFDVRTPFKAGPAFGFPSELTESVTMFLFCSCTTLEIQSIVNLSMFYFRALIFRWAENDAKVGIPLEPSKSSDEKVHQIPKF